jgi:hypothetical protein
VARPYFKTTASAAAGPTSRAAVGADGMLDRTAGGHVGQSDRGREPAEADWRHLCWLLGKARIDSHLFQTPSADFAGRRVDIRQARAQASDLGLCRSKDHTTAVLWRQKDEAIMTRRAQSAVPAQSSDCAGDAGRPGHWGQSSRSNSIVAAAAHPKWQELAEQT